MMDTSLTYIEMCVQAEEIRVMRGHPKKRGYAHNWQDGDVYCTYTPSGNDGIIYPVIPGGEFLYLRQLSGTSEIRNWCEGCEAEYGGEDMTSYIWLPRQDQLQAMIYEMTHEVPANDIILRLHLDMWSLIPFLCGFAYDWEPVEGEAGGMRATINSYAQRFSSMEQLLLAFVMQKRYQKRWNGAGWVAGD